MRICSKFDTGKQVNRYQEGSWEWRCSGAGLRLDKGPVWELACWAKVTNSKTSKYFKFVSAAKSKTVTADYKRKAKDDVVTAKMENKTDNSLQSHLDYSCHENTAGSQVPTNIYISNLHELMASYHNVNVIASSSKDCH